MVIWVYKISYLSLCVLADQFAGMGAFDEQFLEGCVLGLMNDHVICCPLVLGIMAYLVFVVPPLWLVVINSVPVLRRFGLKKGSPESLLLDGGSFCFILFSFVPSGVKTFGLGSLFLYGGMKGLEYLVVPTMKKGIDLISWLFDFSYGGGSEVTYDDLVSSNRAEVTPSLGVDEIKSGGFPSVSAPSKPIVYLQDGWDLSGDPGEDHGPPIVEGTKFIDLNFEETSMLMHGLAEYYWEEVEDFFDKSPEEQEEAVNFVLSRVFKHTRGGPEYDYVCNIKAFMQSCGVGIPEEGDLLQEKELEVKAVEGPVVEGGYTIPDLSLADSVGNTLSLVFGIHSGQIDRVASFEGGFIKLCVDKVESPTWAKVLSSLSMSDLVSVKDLYNSNKMSLEQLSFLLEWELGACDGSHGHGEGGLKSSWESLLNNQLMAGEVLRLPFDTRPASFASNKALPYELDLSDCLSRKGLNKSLSVIENNHSLTRFDGFEPEGGVSGVLDEMRSLRESSYSHMSLPLSVGALAVGTGVAMFALGCVLSLMEVLSG